MNCHFETEEACRDNEYGYMFVYNLGGNNGDDLTGNQTSLVNNVELYNIQYAHWSGNIFADFEAYVFFFGGGNPYYDGKTSH